MVGPQQSENKQDYVDENHPIEIAKRVAAAVQPTPEQRQYILAKARGVYTKTPTVGVKVKRRLFKTLKKTGKKLISSAKLSQARAVQRRKVDYARRVALYKQRVALAKRRAMANRKTQRRPVARRPIARKTIQQRQRELSRTKTPGFYNQDAERDNPYGLKSRYKMNFGQNVLTEKDPKNHVVKLNGKYQWRAN